MRSIERRFKNIQKKNPYWGSYICFIEVIKNQNFNKKTICNWFNKLVDKDDYYKEDKKMLIAHLLSASKSTEDYQK